MTISRNQLIEQFIELMGCIFRATKAGFHSALKEEFNLNGSDMMVLFFVAHHSKGSTTKDIAESLNITSGAVTQFVDSLINKDLVKIENNLTDRRTHKIILSKNAQSILKKLKKQYLEQFKNRFSTFSVEDLKIMVKLMSKFSQSQSRIK